MSHFFYFCISRPSKVSSALVNKDIFFYIKFASFWYIICSVPNLIPIWFSSHGLTCKTEYSKSNNVLLYTDGNKSKCSGNLKEKKIFQKKSSKKFYEKLYTKQTSTAATTEYLSKIPNLCETEISLDVS